MARRILLIELRNRAESAKAGALAALHRAKGENVPYNQGRAGAFTDIIKWIDEMEKGRGDAPGKG